MNILCFILAILLLFYLVYSQRVGNYKQSFITLGCILLGLEAGLRHIAVGPDTPNYYFLYQQACNSSWAELFAGFTAAGSEFRDPAFAIIEKAFGSIVPSWQLFLMAVATFYFYALRNVLIRYIETLEGALLAFVLYLSLFNIIALSGIRQCITTGIAFLIIPLINERKWKFVIPIILVGATVHISLLFMIMFIPLIILPNRITKKLYFIAIVLIPLIAVGARNIILYMTGFMANDYYSGYANSDSNDNPIVYVFICSIISIYEYLNFNKLVKFKKTSFLVPSNILMTLTVPIIFLDGTMIRIGQYFTLYIMVSLPLIFDCTSYRKIAYWLCIVFLSFRIFTSNDLYYFFWETVPGYIY